MSEIKREGRIQLEETNLFKFMQRGELLKHFYPENVRTARDLVGEVLDSCVDNDYYGIPGVFDGRIIKHWFDSHISAFTGERSNNNLPDDSEYNKLVDWAAEQTGVAADDIHKFIKVVG